MAVIKLLTSLFLHYFLWQTYYKMAVMIPISWYSCPCVVPFLWVLVETVICFWPRECDKREGISLPWKSDIKIVNVHLASRFSTESLTYWFWWIKLPSCKPSCGEAHGAMYCWLAARKELKLSVWQSERNSVLTIVKLKQILPLSGLEMRLQPGPQAECSHVRDSEAEDPVHHAWTPDPQELWENRGMV